MEKKKKKKGRKGSLFFPTKNQAIFHSGAQMCRLDNPK